ncbi:ester cyclase [bacterium]|nr:ester cyclase [bacterium]
MIKQISIYFLLVCFIASCKTENSLIVKKGEKMENFKEIVKPFYTKCLTVGENIDISSVMNSILSDDFKSISSTEIKGKEQLIGQVQYFWKLIPNLKWEIQEMLQDGNRVIVRGIATGNPKGNFFGIELDGSKGFKIMSIDIHTIKNGKIEDVYHIEEWATAMKQLTSK